MLIVLLQLISFVQDPIFNIHLSDWVHGEFNLHSLIVLAGGVFLIYTAVEEIWHMTVFEEHAHGKAKEDEPTSARAVITMIVVMNLVFSFDSILSAIALTDVVWIMTTAIIIGGVLMIWLADRVAAFLERNRMYEVMGLFILFVVGIMLLTEGGHLAHLELFGNHITPMSKTTFYFVITVLVLTDVVQTRYKRKLMAKAKKYRQKDGDASEAAPVTT